MPANNQSKSKSIRPLDGGFSKYISTLDEIIEYVEHTPSLTKDDLKHWYWKNHPKWRVGPPRGRRARATGRRYDDTTKAYIDSLFRCGLLVEVSKGVRCKIAVRERDKKRKIIETINENVEFILDMLRGAKDGVTVDDLKKQAAEEHKLDLDKNQILFRRGWLESAQMLEISGGELRATLDGKRLLGLDSREPAAKPKPKPADRPLLPSSPPVHDAEFNGVGEGQEHKALKQYVFDNCKKIFGVDFTTREIEYELPSGDRVDVTAASHLAVWHIEVKSRISRHNDIRRGIYQCVKYKAVADAVERVEGRVREVRSLLVVGKELPDSELAELARTLKIRVLVVDDRTD